MQIQLILLKIDWISLTDILSYSGIIQITLNISFYYYLFSAKFLYILVYFYFVTYLRILPYYYYLLAIYLIFLISFLFVCMYDCICMDVYNITYVLCMCV